MKLNFTVPNFSVQTMAHGDGCMRNANNRTFEIEIPKDCDSKTVLKNLLVNFSPASFGACEGAGDESGSENVCSETSSEDCMERGERRMRIRDNAKLTKKKLKDDRKKRKGLMKECKKKAKEIIKDFKMREKQRRRKEKMRLKRIKRFEKQKDKEEKKCRKERKKCEKRKEKVRRAKEKEKLRTLKEKMKMKCNSLKYAKASDCEDNEDEAEQNCLARSRAATRESRDAKEREKCCG